MFTKSLLSCALASVLTLPLCAQTTIALQYIDDFGGGGPPTNPLVDENGIPLFAGDANTGTGDIVQMGYFAGVDSNMDVALFTATEWNNFTPITSVGGTHLVTIGDPGGISGNMGIISTSVTFDNTNDIPPLPGVDSRLGVRFFNHTDLGGSTFFNTVTSNNTNWRFTPPATPFPFPNNLNMDDASGGAMVWEDSLNALQTSIMIPEPSTMTLLLLGAASCLLSRRRRTLF